MVAFWKDVAEKAPHHSRASWMKYYRRHKHELNRSITDEPLPMRPTKKLRYHRRDDVLLARYFANKPEGTLDKIFQNFAKIVSGTFSNSNYILAKVSRGFVSVPLSSMERVAGTLPSA